MANITLELELASNMLGKLKPETRKRLQRVVDKPTNYSWDRAYSILLSPSMTLWQAVLEVEPSFVREKRYDAPWPRVPSTRTILKAIQFATH